MRRHDGVYRDFLVRVVLSRDEEGIVREWVGTCIDITEHKRAEQSLRRVSEELRRSNVELERFASVVSHDLQKPLRAVSGFASLLQTRYHGRLDGKADAFLEGTVDGAARMQQLINDLLAYARVGTIVQTAHLVQTNEVLEAALANLVVAIGESGAAVTHDPLPEVVADRSQLVQLFQNLVGNAVKFRGDGVPSIHVSAVRRGGQWVFSVRDNGIGIIPAQQQRVFEIFQRLHARKKYSGTGIGLAICKRIVERHGGRIWVESRPGLGATFFFRLVPDTQNAD